MAKLLSHNKVKKSTKTFNCGGCEAILQNWSFEQFINEFNPTDDEIEALMAAKSKGYQILRGEPYIKQFSVDGSDSWVRRSIPRIYEICDKYNVF